MSEGEPNQGLTRREVIRKGAILGGTVMWVTPIVQTVGMSRALAAEPSPADNCIPQWASSVAFVDQGFRKNGTSVLDERSNPNNALGPPDSPAEKPGAPDNELPFFSLGYAGVLVVKFSQRAYVDTGSEVLVVETTNPGSGWPEEKANVSVSQDGVTFYPVGTATNNPTTSEFDLDGIPVEWIQYVRLEDDTNAALHVPEDDAFDVNAVGISCPEEV